MLTFLLTGIFLIRCASGIISPSDGDAFVLVPQGEDPEHSQNRVVIPQGMFKIRSKNCISIQFMAVVNLLFPVLYRILEYTNTDTPLPKETSIIVAIMERLKWLLAYLTTCPLFRSDEPS